MTINYAVSFEFETRAPVTHRGTVSGTSANVCASRAMREARKALKPIQWSSCVCVLDRGPLAKAEGAIEPMVEPATTR